MRLLITIALILLAGSKCFAQSVYETIDGCAKTDSIKVFYSSSPLKRHNKSITIKFNDGFSDTFFLYRNNLFCDSIFLKSEFSTSTTGKSLKCDLPLKFFYKNPVLTLKNRDGSICLNLIIEDKYKFVSISRIKGVWMLNYSNKDNYIYE
jgi:hypothetical protein